MLLVHYLEFMDSNLPVFKSIYMFSNRDFVKNCAFRNAAHTEMQSVLMCETNKYLATSHVFLFIATTRFLTTDGKVCKVRARTSVHEKKERKGRE